jgi:hypothetical protein
MQRIRYLRKPRIVLADDCCVHLEETTVLEGTDADVAVWLESHVPERTIAAAQGLLRPVLNSLWLSEPHLSAYREHLHRFQAIVLVPFKPHAPVQDYEANLAELLDETDRCGIPRDKLIVDLAILPYARQPDTAVYRDRLDVIHAQGLRTAAAFDNFIHRAPGKRKLLAELRTALGDKLNYALITDKYYDALE